MTQNMPEISCPQCGKSEIYISLIKGREDRCLCCRTPMFLKICKSCGAENRGVYECQTCGKSLGSISDITPDTLFIEETEATPIQLKLAQIEKDIPRMPYNTTIENYCTKQQKRNFWHKKLSVAEKLSFYKRMNKSYPEGCFDPNTFFEAFDKVSMKEGYFLDYRYCDNDYCGEAAIFARKSGSKSLILARDESREHKEQVFDVIDFEKSPSGIFQLAVFFAVHDKFYLFAHSRYRIYQPILTRKQHEDLIDYNNDNLKPEAVERLKKLDIRPRIVIENTDKAQVTFFTYNKYKGFFWKRYNFEHNRFREGESEQIAWLLRTGHF